MEDESIFPLSGDHRGIHRQTKPRWALKRHRKWLWILDQHLSLSSINILKNPSIKLCSKFELFYFDPHRGTEKKKNESIEIHAKTNCNNWTNRETASGQKWRQSIVQINQQRSLEVLLLKPLIARRKLRFSSVPKRNLNNKHSEKWERTNVLTNGVYLIFFGGIVRVDFRSQVAAHVSDDCDQLRWLITKSIQTMKNLLKFYRSRTCVSHKVSSVISSMWSLHRDSETLLDYTLMIL